MGYCHLDFSTISLSPILWTKIEISISYSISISY
jgi:hypothetical protein